jgi:ABC-2 type transport system ATP-binding protein
MVRGIRERGKTVLLTTHLMEEAERLCDRVAIIERGRVIDVGTPEGLVRRHCPEQTVVLSTPDPAARSHFAAVPGLESLEEHDCRYTLRGRSDDLVTDIIHCISEHRMHVTEFRTGTSNLEDVFLKLTGRSIRD